MVGQAQSLVTTVQNGDRRCAVAEFSVQSERDGFGGRQTHTVIGADADGADDVARNLAGSISLVRQPVTGVVGQGVGGSDNVTTVARVAEAGVVKNEVGHCEAVFCNGRCPITQMCAAKRDLWGRCVDRATPDDVAVLAVAACITAAQANLVKTLSDRGQRVGPGRKQNTRIGHGSGLPVCGTGRAAGGIKAFHRNLGRACPMHGRLSQSVDFVPRQDAIIDGNFIRLAVKDGRVTLVAAEL